MKFKTHNDQPIIAHGTSRFSSIQATTDQLVKAFGDPWIGEPGPTDAPLIHWTLQFDNGSIATIYLHGYKVLPDPSDVVFWGIGAHRAETSYAVHQAFRDAHGLLAKRSAA